MCLIACGSGAPGAKDHGLASRPPPQLTHSVGAASPPASNAQLLDSTPAPASIALPSALPELIQIFETGQPTLDAALPRTPCPGFDPAWKPGGAWIEDYTRDDTLVTIHGRARDASDVAAILCRLALSAHFSDVSLASAGRAAADLRFEMRFRLIGAAPVREKLVTFEHAPQRAKPGTAEPEVWSIAIDEVILLGLTTGTAPSALFSDPGDVGHVMRVGDTLGKSADQIWTLRGISRDRVHFVHLEKDGKTSQKTLLLKK